MNPLKYAAPTKIEDACGASSDESAMLLAGGTTMIDLMKLNVLTPQSLVYIKPLLDAQIDVQKDQVTIGAGCTMSELADDENLRKMFPAIRHSLILAASPQIRNMATIGGNLLQRTRSTYYRHLDFPVHAANVNSDELPFGEGADVSSLAILGNGAKLVGTYPGDFAVVLVAFNGEINIQGPVGSRTIAAREFYELPNESFSYSTVLQPGEIITSISLPITPMCSNSFYLKIRERSSYAFALASVAVGLELEGKGAEANIKYATLALGGLGSIPWYDPKAAEMLVGKKATDATFEATATAMLADANPPAGSEYKVKLAQNAIVRACQTLRDSGVPDDSQLWAFQHGRA